jgi:hypothetical protein
MKTLLFLTLFIVSTFSSAEMLDKYNTKITVVYINSGGQYLMQVEGISGWLALGKAGDPIADALYSTALTAKVSNQQKVWVRYWTNANGGHPSVGIITIK